MNFITKNILTIKDEINSISKIYKIDYKKISLLAVSKGQSVKSIEIAMFSGQRIFGENYVQEGIKKIIWFNKNRKNNNIIWHFIGSLQSNKVKFIAKYFDWCQTISSDELAFKLNSYRSKKKNPIKVLIQVNISNEKSKSGILPEKILELAKTISLLPNLKLHGIMAIPKIETDFNKQLTYCEKMKNLYLLLKEKYEKVDTLSLGMSNDMTAAIISGSTLLRIGRKIFYENKLTNNYSFK